MNQKGIAPIAIIGIAIILIMVGGSSYYLINKNKAQKEDKQNQEKFIYINLIEREKKEGILYFEREYFKFNLEGEKIIVLTIPDSGYIHGSINKNIKVKDLNEVKNCLIENKNIPCIPDTKNINILFGADYTKEGNELFSFSKQALFVFNDQNNVFELDPNSDISLDQINGLFNEDESKFLNDNKKEIYNLIISGNEFQKEWANSMLENDIEPYIKVTEPNKTKSFCFGEQIFIEWESKKISSLRLMIRKYYLYGYTNYYISGNSLDYPSTFNETGEEGVGIVPWTVGKADSKMYPGETFKIAIEAKDENGNMIEDESDEFFYIIDCLEPSFSLFFLETDDKEFIARTLFDNYLKQYLSEDFSSKNRLTDYTIDNINVVEDLSKESCFSFNVSFSVDPSQGNSYWFSGNGKIQENGWITGKYLAVDAVKNNNGWSIRRILGTANYPHKCDE